MKVAVVGRHPDLEIGFNGVMSLLWSMGLTLNGCDVVLYLPQSEVHDTQRLLDKSGVGSLDRLSRYGVDFDIQVMEDAYSIDSNVDAVIWQSYRPQEEVLRKQIRRRGFFLAKNPPRIFSGDRQKDIRKALGLVKEYDLIAASLYSDRLEAEDLIPGSPHFAYVPRGFDLNFLQPRKADHPIIGFDKAVKAHEFGRQSIRHIISAGLCVKQSHPSVEFWSLRDSVPELNSRRMPLMGYPDFYNEFINRLSIYMTIDFDYSIHGKGKVPDQNYGHRYIGLYENQVVEAQLAGGLIVSRYGDIPSELLMDPDGSVFFDINDTNEIANLIINNIEDFKQRSDLVKERAASRHDYLNTTNAMKIELAKRVNC